MQALRAVSRAGARAQLAVARPAQVRAFASATPAAHGADAAHDAHDDHHDHLMWEGERKPFGWPLAVLVFVIGGGLGTIYSAVAITQSKFLKK